MRPVGTNASEMNELIELRLGLKLSQIELGELLQLSSWTVSRYERGERTPPYWYYYALRWLAENYSRDQD